MRKWHRWISVVFGVFLLWIAGTGVASQVVPLWQNGGFENEAREKAEREAKAVAAAVAPPASAHEEPDNAPAAKASAAPGAAPFVCPETMICRPKPTGGRSLVGTLHHLHSGESFGPIGTVISLLSGIALLFFAFSGLWMYARMWSNRRERALKPGWFWN